VTNAQLYFAVGVPLAVNSVLVLMVFWALSARITDLRITLSDRINDLRDSLRAELRRVEEIFDARLKHLEEK
jgi:hypothetical protein